MIKNEKIDAIFLITDPRYFTWLFQMENEIRKKVPITYLNIWDSVPAPMYNKEFYESCDSLLGISKQTVNINKIVLGDKSQQKIISYVPHGLNHNFFFPIDENHKDWDKFKEFKKTLFGEKEYKYTAIFNSRNIRRKQVSDVILAWRMFCDKIGEEQAKDCALILHTQPQDENGTDLQALIEYLCPDYCNVLISHNKLATEHMNYLYNCADIGILLSSNEGWGLMLTECLLTGTPFIANVTGGMQDQMRFEDEDEEWIDFNEDFPSNHKGTYTKCGDWAFPVFPKVNTLVGSIPTPYIFDDICNTGDVVDRLIQTYYIGKEKLSNKGLKGRKWATSSEAGFTMEYQADRIIENMDKLFETWTPREKYELLADTDYQPRVLKHKLTY
jgi:hypothetical protein